MENIVLVPYSEIRCCTVLVEYSVSGMKGS